MSRIVAVTGRSGSGKSTVAAWYAKNGYPVLDGDAISRQVTQPGSPCLSALAHAFGADILDENGELRRRKLAARAFADEASTRCLTDITHPAIIDTLLQKARAFFDAGHPIVFVDGAVIIGEAFEPYCDRIIVVTAPEKAAIQRICSRDAITPEAAKKRLAAQMSQEEMEAAADYCIANTGTKEQLQQKAQQVLDALLAEGAE